MKLFQSILSASLLVQFHLLFVVGHVTCNNLKPNLNYTFYGSKTIYKNANEYLAAAQRDLPASFDDTLLVEKDKKLRADSCTPMAFYFVGRHSGRFPDAKEIEQYNKVLGTLKEKIKTKSTCTHELGDLLQWHPRMVPKHDNLITELGAKEEHQIAGRFRDIYPELFDAKQTDIEIGVSSKLRTAQTAAQFLQEVDGLTLDKCETLPTNDINAINYNVDKVLESECYKQLKDSHKKPFLEFHTFCKDLVGKKVGQKKHEDPLVESAKDIKLRMDIANRVAAELGLVDSGEDPPIDLDVLDSIYSMCKFENALSDHSIWCRLFKEEDIKALEYISDVSNYIKHAYGPKALFRQSCPLVKDLLKALHQATQLSPTDKKRSYFYFSHAVPMKMLMATFGLFRDEKSFTEEIIKKFTLDMKVPEKRNWRSSLISPFSANLVFILYRCRKPGKEEVQHKILATVTERPVKLDVCEETVCNSEEFFAAYDKPEECNWQEICANNDI